jgi:hypothetical protein
MAHKHGTRWPVRLTKKDVNKNKTTKVDRETRGVELDTSSPIGHEEFGMHMAEEMKGTDRPRGDADDAMEGPGDDQRTDDQDAMVDQPLNPKRTDRSRPD